MSAVTWTRTWPGPTTLATMDSTRWRSRSSKSVVSLFLADGGGVGAGLVVAAGQQIALVVDDGDAFGRQAGNRGGDQMLDRLHLAAAEHAAGLEHDRGARRLVVAREDLAFGDDEMHARAVDALDGLDRAGEFAFEGAQPVDVLHEGGGAEGVGLVEDLIADAGGGKIVGGQLPCAAWSRGRREPGSCRRRPWRRMSTFIASSLAVTAAASRGSRPGEQDGLGRLGERAGDIEKECGERGGDAGHDAETRRTDRFDKFRQCLPSA